MEDHPVSGPVEPVGDGGADIAATAHEDGNWVHGSGSIRRGRSRPPSEVRVMRGTFLELDPPHRLVFTFGWETDFRRDRCPPGLPGSRQP